MRKSLPGLLPILVLLACGSRPKRSPVLAEAYAGPATLKIRKDIPTQSPVVATVKFGDRLEIIGNRRRFIRVRTASGAEGWTDERALLSAQEMKRIRDLAQKARSLPSQGEATTFDILNVHTEPERQSPSFLQVKEGEKVDVLAHWVSPRNAASARAPLIPPTPKKPKPPPRKKKKAVKYEPPPLPSPPQLPPDWLELSKTPAGATEDPEAEKPEKEEPKRVPADDWSLVRNSAGQSGWVLTRRLFMAIPDEVAQYAEGRRITAYRALGEVRDGDQIRHNWVWTTINSGLQTYDFDSFRVFIWNLRRHRYETAYIERNLKGYYPLLLHPVELSAPVRARDGPASTSFPGFSVCVEKASGERYRRSYAFIVNIVRFAGEKPCEASPFEFRPGGAEPTAPLSPPAEPSSRPGLFERLGQRLKTLGRSLFHK